MQKIIICVQFVFASYFSMSQMLCNHLEACLTVQEEELQVDSDEFGKKARHQVVVRCLATQIVMSGFF